MTSLALHSAPRNAPFKIGSVRLIAGLVAVFVVLLDLVLGVFISRITGGLY